MSILVKRDKRARLTSAAESIEDAMAQGDTKKAYGLVRSLKKPATSPATRLKDESGAVIVTMSAMRERWARHFSTLLKGRFTDAAVLSTAASVEQKLAWERATDMAPGAAPSMLQVRPRFATAQPHKGVGPDSLPNELYRLAPRALASGLLPLFTKATYRLQEPLAWRGSCLVELCKGKGPIDQCGSFRDIHLKDRTAKVYHSMLRDQLSDAYTATTLGSQCGGIAGRGTNVANRLCRAFAEH